MKSVTLSAWNIQHSRLFDNRRGAAKFSKRCPTKSNATRENPVFWDADHAWRGFLRHVTLLAIVIGHRATPNNAAPWKINFSQLSFRGAARPCYDKQYSLSFFNAWRGTARRGVWSGRTSIQDNSSSSSSSSKHFLRTGRTSAFMMNILRTHEFQESSQQLPDYITDVVSCSLKGAPTPHHSGKY